MYLVKEGSLSPVAYISDAKIGNCGKEGFGNASILIEDSTSGSLGKKTIRNTRFVESDSAGVWMQNSQNVDLNNNVFFLTTNNSIVVSDLRTSRQNTKQVRITNNLVIKNIGGLYDEGDLEIASVSILFRRIFGTEGLSEYVLFESNVVAGENGIAYYSPGDICRGFKFNSLISINNKAHSSNYGWVIASRFSQCFNVAGFRAYKVQEGIMMYSALIAPTGAAITANDLIFTDNMNSVTFNMAPSNQISALIQI